MELSRLRRMVRARWWVMVIMALVGVFAALAFTNYNNNRIEPRFEAVSSIEFFSVDNGDEEGTGRGRARVAGDPAVAALVEEATVAAEDINATLLDNPSVSMRPNPEEGRLDFVAVAPTSEAAEAVVDEMRANYLVVDPTDIDVDAEIERLIAEAGETQDRLDALTPEPPPPPEPLAVAVESQLIVIDQRIASVTGQVGIIMDEMRETTSEETIAALEEELDEIAVQLTELKIRRNELETPETPAVTEEEEDVEEAADAAANEGLTPAEQLEKAALEARMVAISEEYLGLQGADVPTAERINLPEIAVSNETPAPTPSSLSGLIGLVAGLVAGLVGLILLDRVQEAVWTPGDMEKMPILAEVPQPSGSRVDLRPRRYQTVRQQGVQSIRSAVLGLFHAEGPATIGFTGLGTTEQGVSELVLDVAHSLAGVGRSVLVVDGQLGGLPAHRDQLAGGATLADLAAHDGDQQTVAAHVEAVLEGCVEMAPNLSVLPGDPRTVDPVDVLASKSFRMLTEQAGARFDVVMVVGPSALSPFAYVMAGLVSAYIVVTTVGRTRQQHIEQLAKQFAGSRSRLVGAVLLGVKPRRGWVPASDLSRSPTSSAPGGGARAGVDIDDEAGQGVLDRIGQSLAALSSDKRDS